MSSDSLNEIAPRHSMSRCVHLYSNVCFSAGVYTRYKPFLLKDKGILKRLIKVCTGPISVKG